MKLTNRQREEIEWHVNRISSTVTEEDRDQFIRMTVHGGVTNKQHERNPIFISKRRLDMTIKMWRTDLIDGIIVMDELRDDDHPYMTRVLNGIEKGLPKEVLEPWYIGCKFLDGKSKLK